MTILDAPALTARVGENHPALPLLNDGTLDTPRVTLALEEATGIVTAYLPWLLAEGGTLVDPLPVRFAASLQGIVVDLALFRLGDTVSTSEDGRARYKANMELLGTIAREFQGGLLGPDSQAAELVEPSEIEGIPDRRFFRKGDL